MSVIFYILLGSGEGLMADGVTVAAVHEEVTGETGSREDLAANLA